VLAQNGLVGKVKIKKDGTPLSGVSIFISDLQLGAVSDAEGNYVLKNIPTGTYLIEVSHVNYASIAREITIQNEISSDFSFAICKVIRCNTL